MEIMQQWYQNFEGWGFLWYLLPILVVVCLIFWSGLERTTSYSSLKTRRNHHRRGSSPPINAPSLLSGRDKYEKLRLPKRLSR